MSNGEFGFHDAVRAFKRELLARALAAHKGNRTHAARALGLQRTYLLRLIREFGLKDGNIAVSKLATCTNGVEAELGGTAEIPCGADTKVLSAPRF